MFEKNFERRWLTSEEEFMNLLNKKDRNQLSERDKTRLRELELRKEETRKIKELAESEKGKREDSHEKENPHVRNPGQEGYF